MLTASSALSPLPGPSSALVALVAPQESDWHLAGPGRANNNNLEELEEQTDHDIVPVAVGVTLAVLVVLVLVAYLFGRRRARQRGYQSV